MVVIKGNIIKSQSYCEVDGCKEAKSRNALQQIQNTLKSSQTKSVKRARSPPGGLKVPAEVSEEESNIPEIESSRSSLIVQLGKEYKCPLSLGKKPLNIYVLMDSIQNWSIITKPIGDELVFYPGKDHEFPGIKKNCIYFK